jgi:1,4-alpha-glucan branching enzyme
MLLLRRGRVAVLPYVFAVLTLLLMTACASRLAPGTPAAVPGGIRFVFDRPAARTVAVAGTFNQWSVTASPLKQDRASGPWTGVIALPPGEHLFMYVVNGSEWVTPPQADDYADDGFGAKNGVVSVGAPSERQER